MKKKPGDKLITYMAYRKKIDKTVRESTKKKIYEKKRKRKRKMPKTLDEKYANWLMVADQKEGKS